jgi:hypothetical protein
MMSARKAKRRVVDMMASTVTVDLRWMMNDPDAARIQAWLKANRGTASSRLHRAMRQYAREYVENLKAGRT